MSTSTASELKLKVSRFIKAPPQRVFEAWTKPEQMMRWFGPGACYLISARNDPREGGEYHLHMNTEGGCGQADNPDKPKETAISGVYRVFKPYTKVAFTWGWDGDVTRADDTLVTVDLAEVQGGTNVTLTHEGFTSEEACEAHTQGWNGTLDKLEARTDAMCNTMTPGHFSWNEYVSLNKEESLAFYTNLFGWTTQAMPGANGIDYTILLKDNVGIGGLLQAPQKGMPAHWLSYVTTKSVDESAETAVKLGGKVMMPPTDIPNVGRIAIIMDPHGAGLGLFQPGMTGEGC